MPDLYASDRDPSELGTGTRRGAHRARRGPLRVLFPLAAAVAAIGFVAVAMDGVPGRDGDSTVAARPAGGTGATADPTDEPRPGGTGAAGEPASPAGAGGASPTPSPVESKESAAEPSPEETEPTRGPADEARESAPVVVLNQTGISGLAAAVADDLRNEGWTVTGTGNFRGTVPSTTVYFPEGMEAEAAAVAADLPGPDRTRPRFGNLATDRLTVVLTEDLR